MCSVTDWDPPCLHVFQLPVSFRFFRVFPFKMQSGNIWVMRPDLEIYSNPLNHQFKGPTWVSGYITWSDYHRGLMTRCSSWSCMYCNGDRLTMSHLVLIKGCGCSVTYSRSPCVDRGQIWSTGRRRCHLHCHCHWPSLSELRSAPAGNEHRRYWQCLFQFLKAHVPCLVSRIT